MEILPQIFLNSLIASSAYLIIALGFNLVYGAAKFVNMAHGAFAAIGAYSVFFMTKIHSLPILISVFFSVIIAGLAGYLSEVLVFGNLRRKKASNFVLFIASLGIFLAAQALLAIFFTAQFQAVVSEINPEDVYKLGSAAITKTQVAMILAAIAVFVLAVLFLSRTNLGRSIRAITDDEEVAKIIGLDTEKIMKIVFFLSAGLAGLAGIFIGFDIGVTPSMGLPIVLAGAIASIAGGIGNTAGGAVGALILGFVENFGIWKLPSEWKSAIALAIFVFFLIFRPQGLLNKK